MEFLQNYPSLVGKTIAFSWMPEFGDIMVLATTNQEVLVARFDIDHDDDHDEVKTIRILGKHQAMHFLESYKGSYVRNNLAELGIFDLAAFKKREQERLEQEAAERKKRKEEEEFRTYERLHAKFGKKD